MTKIGTHLKKNKNAYIACGVTAVVAGLGVLLVSRSGNVSISNPAVVNWKPIANTVQVSMTRPGPKAFVVQCLENQKMWPSLRATAKDIGHNPGTLSAHLKGLVPDIDGLHYEKLAEI